MSKTIEQIYIDNPASGMEQDDLLYLGRSPYDSDDDFAIKFPDFADSITWNNGSIPVSNLGVGMSNATPKFKASMTGLPSIAPSTLLVAPFNSVIYDNSGFFNTGTFTFQPTIAGMYYIYASIYLAIPNTAPNGTPLVLALSKNNIRTSTGAAYYYNSASATLALGVNVSDIIPMNGTTDFINAVVYQGTSAACSVTFTPTGSVNNSCILVGSLLT